MQVLVVEDERHAAQKLIKMLKTAEPEIQVLDVIESVQQAVEWFIVNPEPDLVFMDIQLDDGICFEIFEAVSVSAPIIFTTAFNEYAIRAFRVNSIDYLLKPVDEVLLQQAMDKYKKLYTAKPDRQFRFD